MSKPVFSDPFSFKGRRNRMSFVFLALTLAALISAVNSIYFIVNDPVIATYFLFPLNCLALLSFTAAMSQRCRDIGFSGWLGVVLFMIGLAPILLIILCIKRGASHANIYGEDPLKQCQ